MFRNLGDFINSLASAGELKTISRHVSSHLEISKITDNESKSPKGGKGLFFTNVRGSSFPVATNLFGSEKRICMALGVKNLDDLGKGIREYLELDPPRNLKEILHLIPKAMAMPRFFPRTVSTKEAPCREVVYKGKEVDLSILPILHCWPKDGGPFVTLPLVFTRSLRTGKRNVGMYRLQVFDKNTTGMHWHIHKDGSHYFNEYREAGKRMPVAVAIGADPAVVYAATAPMPRGIDEMILAGFIRKKPVKMVKCLTIDMEVPAESEFVLEGYVDPEERRLEGPFGDHTGYYSLADHYPVFHVTAITHRKNPVYQATLVGRPPMEDCYLAKATERLFLPMLQAVMPEIRDYWFPWEGVFHNIVIVSIEKEYPGHAQKLMSGLWGQGQMSFCKAIIVVDKWVNPSNAVDVIKELITKFDMKRDITITKGVLDVLDHSSPFPNFGSKLGIDLTNPFSGEPKREKALNHGPSADDTDQASDIKSIVKGVSRTRHLFRELCSTDSPRNLVLAVCVEKGRSRGGKDFAEELLDLDPLFMFNIIILFDSDINLADDSLMLWKLFNNVDPGRDLFMKNNRMVVDACKKGIMDGHHREWPEDLVFDP